MKLKPNQINALKFIEDHPGGTRHKAIMGWRWFFDAPELKRAPFRTSTLYGLEELGMLKFSKLSVFEQKVELSELGKKVLEELSH